MSNLKLDLLTILVVDQCLQANVVEDLLLGALQNHGRHNARLHGFNPTESADAPPITRLQTGTDTRPAELSGHSPV